MNTIKNISNKLLGKPGIDELNEAIEKLSELALRISPEAELQVNFVDKSEVHTSVNKAVKSIRNLERLYSHKALLRDPKIAQEYQDIARALKTINKITANRRKENAKFRESFKKRRLNKGSSNE